MASLGRCAAGLGAQQSGLKEPGQCRKAGVRTRLKRFLHGIGEQPGLRQHAHRNIKELGKVWGDQIM